MASIDISPKDQSILEVVGSYFTEIFYNVLYLDTKKIFDVSKEQSLTDLYIDKINDYVKLVKTDDHTYKSMVKSLYEYFKKTTPNKSISFNTFVDIIVRVCVPEQYFAKFRHDDKDGTLSMILLHGLEELSLYCISDGLPFIIDKRPNSYKPIQDRALATLIVYRQTLMNEFYSSRSRDPEASNKKIISSQNKKIKELEKYIEELEAENEDLQGANEEFEKENRKQEKIINKLEDEKRQLLDKILNSNVTQVKSRHFREEAVEEEESSVEEVKPKRSHKKSSKKKKHNKPVIDSSFFDGPADVPDLPPVTVKETPKQEESEEEEVENTRPEIVTVPEPSFGELSKLLENDDYIAGY